jgi:hypothetical protein
MEGGGNVQFEMAQGFRETISPRGSERGQIEPKEDRFALIQSDAGCTTMIPDQA